MKNRILLQFAALLVVAGCGAPDVQPGVNSVGEMMVTTPTTLKNVSSSETPDTNGVSRTWSKNGLPTDRLVLIAGVKSGETIFKAGGRPYRSGMSQEDMADVVQSSIGYAVNDPSAKISANSSRELNPTVQEGQMFDFDAAAAGNISYLGMAGSFVYEDRLYTLMFMANDPAVYAELRGEADSVISSATTRVKTLGRF